MADLHDVWIRPESYEAEPRSQLYNPSLPIALFQAVCSGRNMALFACGVLLYFIGRGAL